MNLLVQEKKDLQSRVDELNRHVAAGGENPLVAENAELKAQLELFKSNNFVSFMSMHQRLLIIISTIGY